MKIFKSKQKKPNGRYNPVTSEMIFSIPPGHPCCGKEVQFRDSLTETNRLILKEIRDNLDIFKFYWMNRGNYLIKESIDSKTIRIESLQQLKVIIDEKRASTSSN